MPPGFMYSMYPMHPIFGLGFMMFTWIIQLVIAYFVYKDAKEQNMSAPLWFILVILPMVGFLLAILYVIIREVRMPIEPKNTPLNILKERLAKGEITTEEYEQRKEALMK
jgi:putative membrane protein